MMPVIIATALDRYVRGDDILGHQGHDLVLIKLELLVGHVWSYGLL